MRIRRILVPTDCSEASEAAVRYALDLAVSLDARLTLLHCYQIEVYPVAPDGTAFIATPQSITEAAQLADVALDKFVARAIPTDSAVDTRVVAGPAGEAIPQLARDEQFDLIVMGTHGRTGLRHLLLGSVAERVVRTSTTPVLTVRHDDHASPAAFSSPPVA